MELWAAFLVILLVLIVIIKVDFIRLFIGIWKMQGFYKTSGKFERRIKNAKTRILFLGDSTGFGFGIMDCRNSVAGRFGKDFPKAEIRNECVVGFTTKRLLDFMNNFDAGNRKFDLVIIMIGGNDIMKFYDLEHSKKNVAGILDRARKIGRNVILMPPGNVGLGPIFPWILKGIYTRRTRRFRKEFMKIAHAKGVVYTDMFVERKDDISLREVRKYYAADYLHPSDEAYGFWYKNLREVMRGEKIRI